MTRQKLLLTLAVGLALATSVVMASQFAARLNWGGGGETPTAQATTSAIATSGDSETRKQSQTAEINASVSANQGTELPAMLQAFDRILGLSEELSNDSLKRLKKQSRSREDYEHLADQRSHLTTNLPAPLEQEEQQLSDDVMLKVQNITTTITKAIGADLNTDAEIFTANKTAARMMIDVREKYANNPSILTKEIKEVELYRDQKIMLILSDVEKEKFARMIRIPTSDDTPGNKGLDIIYNF